ncbi:MAG TPA: MotA/TolQ/ExbB proton channel family protein [Opitutaceae bacterium]|nr:MotA/TolQ/ExbB proton channel family protein [Opitutaceae bacterium]
MISRNKGIFSLEFLVPVLAFVLSVVVVTVAYRGYVTPHASDFMVKRKLMVTQGGNSEVLKERPLFIIIKDLEPKFEIIFCLWGMLILGYKLVHVTRERRLFKYDFVRVQPGERIIPEDALDRYKELKTAIERESRWRERLLPECILASLHRFHATASVQDAANAVRERAELASDELDSSLGLVRYIAWAIPAIGFIGTVRGIGDALNHAEQAIHGDISDVTSGLGLAFNSTFVGLALCIVLMFWLHVVQGRQEAFIIETQTFCRDKLIDVMKVPTKEESASVFA